MLWVAAVFVAAFAFFPDEAPTRHRPNRTVEKSGIPESFPPLIDKDRHFPFPRDIVKRLISSLLILLLAFSPGGFAMQLRYDCFMTGQKNLATCCCGDDEAAPEGSRCGDPGSAGDQDDSPVLGDAPCCQAHWEVVWGPDPASPLVSPVNPVPTAIPAPSVTAALSAPRLTASQDRFPSGIPPGTAATVPLRVRHCRFLI